MQNKLALKNNCFITCSGLQEVVEIVREHYLCVKKLPLQATGPLHNTSPSLSVHSQTSVYLSILQPGFLVVIHLVRSL